MLPVQLLLGLAEGRSSCDGCGKTALVLVRAPALKCCRDKAVIVSCSLDSGVQSMCNF